MTVTTRVVLPTLGERLETLEEALSSVASQTVRTRVVLVVPSAATGARAIGRRYNATLLDDPGRGLAAAMNTGLGLEGDEAYFAWLNDDDLLRPGGLDLLTRLLDASPDAPAAYGACDYIDEHNRLIGTSRLGPWAARILPWGPDLVPMPSTLTRLDAVRQVGGYCESLRFAIDLDLLRRLQRLGRFVSTRASVAAFRWHADSLTVANRRASVAETERVKRRYLPETLQPFAPLWHVPVRWATYAAARGVQRRAQRLAAESAGNEASPRSWVRAGAGRAVRVIESRRRGGMHA